MSRFRKFVGTVLSPVWLLDLEMNASTRSVLASSVKKNSYWLDVGCGLKPFLSCFDHAHYTGIDIEVSGRPGDMKKPDKFFDGINIPYGDNVFDGVLCTQVLEHVEELDLLLAECNRVVKLGGCLIVSVPFLYREHEQPYDFRRFTSFGLMLLLNRSGFQVNSCLKYPSAIETIATLFSIHIANNIGSKSRVAYILTGFFLSLPALALSKLLSKLLPDNKDLYVHLISSSTKLESLRR